MTECPHCHKKLLSQASPKCSWCGAVIEDAAYQSLADAKREEYYAHTAAHDAQSAAAIAAISTSTDPLAMGPMYGGNYWARQQQWEHLQQIEAQKLEAQQREHDAIQRVEDQTVIAASAENEPIKDETEQAEERFRHLEI